LRNNQNSAVFAALFVTLSIILLSSSIAPTAIRNVPAFAATSTTGIIVPLYTYPTSSTWDTMVKVKSNYPSVPTVAIINPSSGPGSSKDSNYSDGIKKLQTAGISVLGYVYTSYSSRSASSVKADIDKYKSFYPSVNGIFFDEMANWEGKEAYYKSLTDYAKSKGYTLTVGNPGADTISSYVGTVDNIVIYERDGTPSISYLKGWHLNYDKRNFSMLPYNVASLDKTYVTSSTAYVGYMFIASDDLPNPWDSLPSYYSTLSSTINSANGGSSSTTTSYKVTVRSADLNGASFSGIWTTIKNSDGTVLKTGYTPLSFTAKSGATYQVTVSNYGNYVFDHWDNGSTSSTRTITVSKDTTLTAYYSNAPKQVSLTVKSAGLTGSSISGLWVEIYSSTGSLLKTGYTPLSYTVNSGQSYTVIMGEWQNYVFDHWDNGSTSKARTVTINQDTSITAYYKQ
jgi:spherulation-specific family 4 protein